MMPYTVRQSTSLLSVGFLALSLLTFSSPTFAKGDRHALIVGVSEYPKLRRSIHLKGPKNDALLVQSILQQNGFADARVKVLADGVPDGQLPTREAILTALDNLATNVQSDDFVFLHFAGHGSQQPSVPVNGDNDEPDGFDEIFLPRDTGSWSKKDKFVENVISDDELGDKIDAIRDKGAFVWALFDACHSGTMTRAYQVDEQDRRISHEDLGVPEEAVTEALSNVMATRGASQTNSPLNLNKASGNKGRGGMVAFFAAQTTETTPETSLPKGNPNRKRHGVFTYTLMEVIAQNPNITYRQASQELFNRYKANRRRTTPLIEGTNLDAPLFGTQSIGRIQQWPVIKNDDELSLNAGDIHNVSMGAVLALYKSPTAKAKDIIGFAQVVDATSITSQLELIALDEKEDALRLDELPDGSYARLHTPALPMTLVVALPPKMDTSLNKAIDVIKADEEASHQFTFVESTGAADVRLYNHQELIYFLQPSAEFDEKNLKQYRSVGIKHKDFQSILMTNLQRIAKVTNLMRLTSEMSNAGSDPEKTVQLKMSVKRKATKETEVLAPRSNVILNDGDRVTVTLTNNKEVAIDATVLFIDSEYGIQAIYPRRSRTNRIEAGASTRIAKFKIKANTVGLEQLVLIAVDAEPSSPASSFAFLSQPSIESTRAVTAGFARQPLQDLFTRAGFGSQTTRGIAMESEDNMGKGSMEIFSWTTAK